MLVQSNGAQQDALCKTLPTGTHSYSRAVPGKGKARRYEVLKYVFINAKKQH